MNESNFAKYRTALALDRTTLAGIRTALTFATFGFGMVGFFRAMEQMTHSEQAVRLHQAAIHMGIALIVIGLGATILASISHWMILRRLRRGDQLCHSTMAFDHYNRRLPFNPRTLRPLVLVQSMSLIGLSKNPINPPRSL